MSSGMGYTYRVVETAAQIEARALANETTGLEVARREWAALQADCAAFVATYVVSLRLDSAPREGGLTTSTEVRSAAEVLVRHIKEQRERLDRARVAQRNSSLRQRLGQLDDDPTLFASTVSSSRSGRATAKSTAASVSAPVIPTEPMTERVARYLASLDPEATLTDELLSRARLVAASEGNDRDQMLARSLQAEIGRLNEEARRRRETLRHLRELDARCAPLGPGGSAARELVARALRSVGGGGSVQLRDVAAVVETAERVEASTVVRAKLLDAFRATGYEPLLGFETVVPRGGVLVRPSGWDAHAVLASIDNPLLRFEVVRVAVGSDKAESHTEDLEAERKFCSEAPALIDRLKEAGLDERELDQPPAGVVPIHTLAGAPPAVEDDPVTKRAKLKEMGR